MGDYTYYDDLEHPTEFQQRNVLFNYPAFGDQLIIGKFCAIAAGTKFIMGPANHRISSVTTYPFHVFGGGGRRTPRPTWTSSPEGGTSWWATTCGSAGESVILPGVTIGDGAIVAAYSVVTRDVPPTPWPGATPARPLKPRFDPELTQLLLAFRWWDLPSKELAATLPLLCEEDLEKVRQVLRARVGQT